MRTEAEYTAMIPAEPPEDLADWLRQTEGFFGEEYMSYKCISFAEATARRHDESFFMDLRPNKRARPALLWCSACEQELLAVYKPSTAPACRWKSSNAVELWNTDYGEMAHLESGDTISCPCCGQGVTLYAASELPRAEQHIAVVPTVTQGCLVLTTWLLERNKYAGSQRQWAAQLNAYIVDGRRVVRLDNYRRGMGGRLNKLDKWTLVKRFADRMGAPYFYDGLHGRPSLAGTAVENAKLWEYMDATYESGFFPVPYLRLYLKHHNAENLVTAGFGGLLSEGFAKERSCGIGYYSESQTYPAPRLDWVNWKEKRPAQMLGLNKQQARVFKEKGFGLAELMTWRELAGKVDFTTLCSLLDGMPPHIVTQVIHDGMPPVRTVNYLKKQGMEYYYLKDYLQMAESAGMDITQEEVRWPKSLRAAHDRAMQVRKLKEVEKHTAAFREMSERCAGLAWEHDGICIRPALLPAELVAEGNTLHHCVGGYSKSHIEGRIILFIRHTRRPERSWYTLNIDVHTHRQIQLHGYHNEYVNGRTLQIPQRVLAFVAEWRRAVLDHWTLPPAPEKPEKKKRGKAA